MKNATQLYETLNKKKKKSPGVWLNTKDVKSIVEDLDAVRIKNDDDEWLFDDALYSHYQLYLEPSLITNGNTNAEKEIKTEVNSETCFEPMLDDHFDICIDYFLEYVTGKGIGAIKKHASTRDIYNSFTDKQKLAFLNFSYSFIIMLIQRKSKRELDYASSILYNTLDFPKGLENIWFTNKSIEIHSGKIKIKENR